MYFSMPARFWGGRQKKGDRKRPPVLLGSPYYRKLQPFQFNNDVLMFLFKISLNLRVIVKIVISGLKNGEIH